MWKVGQLATEAGLTVRTLHHYDQLGLVRPAHRTSAGHRLYDDADVERLYQVLALRQLGLPLEVIGDVLAGTEPVEVLLRRHQSYLDRRLVAMRTLRAQLATMIATVQGSGSGGIGVTDFLELIRKVTTVDDTVKQYFSEDQLAKLAERREQVGEQAIADVEARWPVLIGRVQQAVDAGTDPASAEAGELAGEWMDLLQQFHGGDDGLRDSLYQMRDDNAEQIEQQGGPSQALIDFITRANEARA